MNQRQLVKLFKALANPRRVELLIHLKRHRIMNVSFAAEKLDLSFRSTSKHLQKLEEVGLVDRKKISNEAHYSLSSGILSEIMLLFARIGQ